MTDLIFPSNIPPLSKEMVDEIDAYFVSIRPWFPLPPEEYQKWKLLKKSLPILYNAFQPPHFKSSEEIPASLAVLAVQKAGICVEVWHEINRYKDKAVPLLEMQIAHPSFL